MQTKSEMINRIAELARENAELKGKLDAYFSNDCIKDIENYKQTLEELKTIAESPRECILSEVSCCDICKRLDKISHIITKTEEE